LLVILVGRVHHEQQKIIEFHQVELEAMMKAEAKKQLSLSDAATGTDSVSFVL